MAIDLKNFTLALAAEPRCRVGVPDPDYLPVLESLRLQTTEAMDLPTSQKAEALERVFWRYTTNCLRCGDRPDEFIITLNAISTYEIRLRIAEDLQLKYARADSESQSEALPIINDVSAYVVVFYQEFLIDLVRKLKQLSEYTPSPRISRLDIDP